MTRNTRAKNDIKSSNLSSSRASENTDKSNSPAVQLAANDPNLKLSSPMQFVLSLKPEPVKKLAIQVLNDIQAVENFNPSRSPSEKRLAQLKMEKNFRSLIKLTKEVARTLPQREAKNSGDSKEASTKTDSALLSEYKLLLKSLNQRIQNVFDENLKPSADIIPVFVEPEHNDRRPFLYVLNSSKQAA
ncbi:MAG: hypothetical protein MK033_05125 [Candidatus Caenarcaniphilales bacterium]|nr:hypothetical protein [Candidatus Caenarcaniphilales bacterium]